MASALLSRFRGQVDSAEDSYDDTDYRSLSDDQTRRHFDTPQQATNGAQETSGLVSENSHSPRRKRRGRRIVFPLSAAAHVERSSKKSLSLWSQCKRIFTRLPQHTEQEAGDNAGVLNAGYSSDEKAQRAESVRYNPAVSSPSQLPGDTGSQPTDIIVPGAPQIAVTAATPGQTESRRQSRGNTRQRAETARQKVYSDNAAGGSILLPSTTPFSSLYPKAFAIWQRKRAKFLSNKIKTTKYTLLSFLPKNLFEQFHRIANFYFVLIIILNFLPMINSFDKYVAMIPLLVVLTFQGTKDIIEDFVRYRSDNRVNNLKTLAYNKADDKYHNIKWKNVQVGDIVRLFCNRVIPADILLLHSSSEHGVCYIETSNIDGETNLKERDVCKGVGKNFRAKDFKSIIQCEKPNSQIDKFTGNIISPTSKESVNKENLLLRGCVIRNTDFVEGIVLYAGHETKAMLNNNGPRYKRSKLERRMNLDVIWCVILLIVMCTIGAVGNSVWASYQSSIYQTILFIPPTADDDTLSPALSGFYMFWTMVILLQVLIPISLYVSIEIVKVAQVYFISNDLDLYHAESNKSVECRALNITEDLGQVQYVFSDKTGTLTENSMVFRRCTVGGVDFPHAANAARIESQEPAPAELNPASQENKKFEEAARAHKRAARAQSAQPFSRDQEQRASYRRPASSSMRAHHRRNPSSLSVQQLQRRMPREPEWKDGTNMVDGLPNSAPGTPAHMRRGVNVRNSAHRLPHKHHRRNISSVSAKAIISNLATEGSDTDLENQLHPDSDELDVEDEFLEADVTPDPVLYKELESVAQNPVGLKLPSDKGRILDFFINLAICNTVVLSTDNAAPKMQQEDMQDVCDAPEESRPLLRSFASSFSVPNFFRKSTSTPPAKFRSLMDDDDSVHEATNNLYTISGDVDVSTNPSSSSLNNLDSVQQLTFAQDYLKQLRYEAESPDEAALVYAAHAYGCSLAHRTKNTVTVTLPKSDQTLSFEVLHTLAFDSTRKRMSVVVRDPRTNQYIVYCKGADSTILQLLRNPRDTIQDDDSGVGSDHSSFSSHQESNSQKVLQTTNLFLNQYARAGLRTLCIAKRVLTEQQYQDWAETHRQAELSMEDREQRIYDSYIRLEKDLELLGATGIEDRLQDGVPETIESLRKAGMQVWVITGDKQETAVNIGYSCKLIEQMDEIIYLNATSQEELEEMLNRHTEEQNDIRGPQPEIQPNPDASLLSFTVRFRAMSQPSTSNHSGNHPPLGIVIDGKTLGFALEKDMRKKFINLARRCHSVLVCRATPLQKGEVVKLVKEELHVMTLAIGDGANDVSMIQVADIGVGISGQEGMQAVMSSDFAMARFCFLQKLVLVHGHWNYARLAAMVLYFFYKNTAFVFLIFWFQFFCGFSGSNPIEQWYLLLFSLLFTSVPPLINGALDKDVSSHNLMRKPKLYLQGINNEMYTGRSFWINIFDGIYQSLAIFLIPYFAYQDSDVETITWGTPVTTACMFANLIHLGIETKTWTWIHWVAQIGSMVLFFVWSFAYNAICPECPPYWIMETLVQTSNFWFSILLATTVALLPRYLIRSLQSSLWPTDTQRERVREHTGGKDPDVDTTANTSVNGTSGGSSSTYQNETYDGCRGEDASDALAYQFENENEYMEIQHNANQNNHNNIYTTPEPPTCVEEGRSASGGVTNPAFASDRTGRPNQSDDPGSSGLRSEPETGETTPQSSAPSAMTMHAILTQHGAAHHGVHHVAFEDDVAHSNNNKASDLMHTVSTDPDRGSPRGGMTPVCDTASLTSESSHVSATGGLVPPSETSPTKIFVDAPAPLDYREDMALSQTLPNMAETASSSLVDCNRNDTVA